MKRLGDMKQIGDMKRQRPNRLSSLDLIPEAGRDDVVWAMQELMKRSRMQEDILIELNERLAVKGIDPISKSVFGRRAVRQAVYAQRMADQEALHAAIAPTLSPAKIDKTTIVISEILKLLITDILDGGPDNLAPKQAMELARAYLAVIQGQKISTERHKAADEFDKKTKEVVDKVAKLTGLTDAAKRAMRKELFGLRDEQQ